MYRERAPIYSEDHKDVRVISAPNGEWQAQRRVTHTGTKERDPWENVGRSCSKQQASTIVFGPRG